MLLGSTPDEPVLGLITCPGGWGLVGKLDGDGAIGGVVLPLGATTPGAGGWLGAVGLPSRLVIPSRARSSSRLGCLGALGSVIGAMIFLWAIETLSSLAGGGVEGTGVGVAICGCWLVCGGCCAGGVVGIIGCCSGATEAVGAADGGIAG